MPKLPPPRDPGELTTIARSQIVAAYAAFSAGNYEQSFALYESAGRLCAEACRFLQRRDQETKDE